MLPAWWTSTPSGMPSSQAWSPCSPPSPHPGGATSAGQAAISQLMQGTRGIGNYHRAR
jgi:hypothetical protein